MEAKQNYNEAVESGVNTQINNELAAMYAYLAMSNYCRRPQVALLGAGQYFLNQSNEERQHAQKLIDYQNERGGAVQLAHIVAPTRQEWPSLLEMFKDALTLERTNNQALLDLHRVASEIGDADLTNFLEEHYLRDQVEEIAEMATRCTQLARIGSGLAVHLYDGELARIAAATNNKNND